MALSRVLLMGPLMLPRTVLLLRLQGPRCSGLTHWLPVVAAVVVVMLLHCCCYALIDQQRQSLGRWQQCLQQLQQ